MCHLLVGLVWLLEGVFFELIIIVTYSPSLIREPNFAVLVVDCVCRRFIYYRNLVSYLRSLFRGDEKITCQKSVIMIIKHDHVHNSSSSISDISDIRDMIWYDRITYQQQHNHLWHKRHTRKFMSMDNSQYEFMPRYYFFYWLII